MLCSLVLAFFFNQGHRSPDEAFVKPPLTFESKANIANWIRAHQGYAGDNIAVRELEFKGAELYVSWLCPFSGVNSEQSWTYKKAPNTSKWKLLDTTLHAGPLLRVYVDERKQKLVYVDRRGKIDKSISLAH